MNKIIESNNISTYLFFFFWMLVPIHGTTILVTKKSVFVSVYHLMIILIISSILFKFIYFLKNRSFEFNKLKFVELNHIILISLFIIINILTSFNQKEIYTKLFISEFSILFIIFICYILKTYLLFDEILKYIVYGGILLLSADIFAYAFRHPIITHSDWLLCGYGGIGVRSTFQNHGSGLVFSLGAAYLLSEKNKLSRAHEKIFERTTWFIILIAQSRTGILAIFILSISRYINEILNFLTKITNYFYSNRNRHFNYIFTSTVLGLFFLALTLVLIKVRVSTVNIRLKQYVIIYDNLSQFPFGGLVHNWKSLSGGFDAHNVIIQYALHYGWIGIFLCLILLILIAVSILKMFKIEQNNRIKCIVLGLVTAIFIEHMLGPDLPPKWLHLCLILINIGFLDNQCMNNLFSHKNSRICRNNNKFLLKKEVKN